MNDETLPVGDPTHTTNSEATARDAIDTVARDLIKVAVNRAIEFDNVTWADYGDLDENDYNRVRSRALDIVEEMEHGEDVYEDAYKLLADRSEGGVDR